MLMGDMFTFFLEIGSQFFTFADNAMIFSGLSLLDFTIGLFLINLVVVNFIILAKRYDSGSSRPSKASKKGE